MCRRSMNHFADIAREETAQATVEYILVAAVMAFFALLQIRALCSAFGSKFIKTAILRMNPLP